MSKKSRSEESNLYIRALKYADEKGTFNYMELLDYLGLEENSEEEINLRFQINEEKIFSYRTTSFFSKYNEEIEATRLSMSVEDKFRLLEYTELKEARASSRSATIFASWALVISIISTTFAIVIGIIQLVNW